MNATDYPTLNAAFDALRAHGGTLYIPNGTYTVTETLNLSGLGYAKGIRIYGDGRGTVIVGDTHGKPVIDMTGTGMITMEQLRITGKSADVGILNGRAGGASAGCCHFSFLFIDGSFSVACVYNIGSEVNRYFNCMFWNTAKGGHGYIFTYRNHFSVESPYQQLDETACNTDLAFYGCFWGVYGGTGTEVNLYMLGPVTADVSLYGGDMSNKEGGRAAILMDGRGTNLHCVRILGMCFETGGARHCIEAVDGTISDVQIRDNKIWSKEESIFVSGEGRREHWTITDNVMESWGETDWGQETGRATMRFNALYNSTVEDTSGRLERTQLTLAENTDFQPTSIGRQRRYARMSIIVEEESKGNHFTVRRSDDIRLPAATTATRVTTLEDGMYGREYFNGAGIGLPMLMNLIPCDAEAIVAPKQGDMVLDSGKNTPDGKPTLAFYDGKQWCYLQTVQASEAGRVNDLPAQGIDDTTQRGDMTRCGIHATWMMMVMMVGGMTLPTCAQAQTAAPPFTSVTTPGGTTSMTNQLQALKYCCSTIDGTEATADCLRAGWHHAADVYRRTWPVPVFRHRRCEPVQLG